MSKVVLMPCENYEPRAVYEALKSGVELLGGMSAFVRPGEKVLLKPNLLRKSTPDQAVTTHPTFLEAAARLSREAGSGQVAWGDSPGGVGTPAKAGEAAGFGAVARKLGLAEADFGRGVEVSVPQGNASKKFTFCPGVLEDCAIINLCKMKTHAFQRITGAVKNMFGCVYGLSKGADHVRFPDPDSFALMLADIHLYLKPRLHIMDGVVAMEGNGPASGTLVEMKVILISEDPVALDTVYCHLIHLDPLLVPTNVKGRAAGIGTWREEEIELLTPQGKLSMAEAVGRWGKPDFDVHRAPSGEAKSLFGIRVPRLRASGPRPVIDENKCVKCGECVDCCPVEGKALLQADKKSVPQYDYGKCIRCYCCQELCPAHAIYVKNG